MPVHQYYLQNIGYFSKWAIPTPLSLVCHFVNTLYRYTCFLFVSFLYHNPYNALYFSKCLYIYMIGSAKTCQILPCLKIDFLIYFETKVSFKQDTSCFIDLHT